MKYDVFISYKRDGGSVWAELIRAILVHKYHLKVFLDVETVRGGEWPKQLDDGIRNSYNIIMVLFEGIGDKIKSDSDGFVQEIEYAKEYEKPIIPFYGLGCDLLYILENKNIPSIIKEVVSIQHSIVKYDHANSEKTYDLLRKQLNGNLELKVTSKYSPCYMSCQLNNEPPYETKEIEENSNLSISLDRNFTGIVHLRFYTKELPIKIERIINVGEKSYIEESQRVNCEYWHWLPDKELTKEVPLDWQLIKIDCQINQSYNPLQAVLGTFNQYLNKESV